MGHLNLSRTLEADKVKKKAKIGNRYNIVLHLTLDTICESDKNTRKHHTKEPFEHKAARNMHESLTKTI